MPIIDPMPIEVHVVVADSDQAGLGIEVEVQLEGVDFHAASKSPLTTSPGAGCCTERPGTTHGRIGFPDSVGLSRQIRPCTRRSPNGDLMQPLSIARWSGVPDREPVGALDRSDLTTFDREMHHLAGIPYRKLDA